jgi:ATP-dependent protease ClpP protease subunit
MKRFPIKAATATEIASIEVIGTIGPSWWDVSGVEESDFRASLNAIPKGQKFKILLNSDGGSVDAGLGMYHALLERRDDATVEITGAACSIATVLMLGAGTIIAPETSTLLIHKPWGGFEGNADEFREMADWLEKKETAMVSAYAARTGKTPGEIRAALKANTKFTGSEAVAWRLADKTSKDDVTPSASATITSAERVFAAAPDWAKVAASVRVPARAGSRAEKEKTMNKQAVLAALKKLGVTLGDAADDAALRAAVIATLQSKGVTVAPDATNDALIAELEKLTAAPNPAPEDKNAAPAAISKMEAALARLEAQNKAHAQATAKRVVAAAIAARKITNQHAAAWEARVLADPDGVSAELESMASISPGEPPVIDVTSEDPRDSARGLKMAGDVFDAFRRGNNVDARDMAKAARAKFTIVTKAQKKLEALAVSTNTIDSALQRTVILADTLRAFKRILAPMRAFSTVYQDVPLEGANTVQVPYYALDTTAPTDFVEGTGYTTYTNTSDSVRTITVNKRKYKLFDYSSATKARQPRFDSMWHLRLAGEELGRAVVADILSVVTAANYPTAAHSGTASAFDYDDLVDIRTSCSEADWPEGARACIIDSGWIGALLKDGRASDVDRSGVTEAKIEGIIRRLAGFDIYESTRVPSNSEQLSGLVCFPSAVLVATAPILPAPGVRNQLVAFEMISDPDTGIGFTYRHGGDQTTDRDQEIIEASYGYAKGEAAALQRIVDTSI